VIGVRGVEDRAVAGGNVTDMAVVTSRGEREPSTPLVSILRDTVIDGWRAWPDIPHTASRFPATPRFQPSYNPLSSLLQSADDLGIRDVANRLGKSLRWVQGKISADAEPSFRFHHYIGRTPRWDENEFQQLRQALIEYGEAKRGGEKRRHRDFGSSSGTDIGTFTGPFAPLDVAAASARVLASRRRRKTGKQPKRSD